METACFYTCSQAGRAVSARGTLRAKRPGETQTLGTQPLGLLSPWYLPRVSPGVCVRGVPPWTLYIVPLQAQLYIHSHLAKGVAGAPPGGRALEAAQSGTQAARSTLTAWNRGA